MTAKRKGMGIPKNETVYVSYHNAEGELLFLMTGKNDTRDWYYLYEVKDGSCEKLGKGRSPKVLEEKYNIDDRLCAQ